MKLFPSATPVKLSSKKLLLICTVLLAVFAAQVCSAQNLDCCANQAELQRVLNDIMSRLPEPSAPSDAATAATSFPVKVVYFIPNNRAQQTNAVQKLKDYIILCQQLYAMEMARNGFYKPGTTDGQTLEYEADQNGQPIVHILNGQHDDAYYRADLWGRVLGEVCAVYSPYRAVILVMCECHIMNADSSVSGGVALGAQWGSTDGWGGVGLVGSNCIWFLEEAKFSDSRPYDGLVLPEFSNIPMKQNVTWAWFEGTTVGQIASCWCGAAAHELGHAFGMPHCFVNDANFAGDLMGNGLRGFRGNFGDYPGEWIRMLRAECDLIAKSRYFNPGQPLTESTAPTQTVQVWVENAASSQNRIHIKATASDSGSGLWRSVAYISPPDSTVDSASFDSYGVANYYINSAEVPGGLTARSYGLDVHAIDNMGNRAWPNVWVQVPASANVQYQNGSWANLPYGAWSTTDNTRLGVSMTARENGTLYLEAEIRPVGTPFTGTPNYISGTGIPYSGTAVMAYMPLALADGAYHWQYRIRNGSSTRSCWVTRGNNDPAVMDFGIDTTPPSTPVVTDSGQYTSSTTQLSASWNVDDPESGIQSYWAAIGATPTDPGSGYVMPWRMSSGTSGTFPGLNLANGTRYYIYIKAKNNAGVYSQVGVSDGITVRTDSPQTVTIAAAKGLADGAYIKLQDVVAGTGRSDLGNLFYVQQQDRSVGIQVNCDGGGVIPTFTAGKPMSVTGTMSTIDGERVVSLPALTLDTGTVTVKPVAMNGRTLGGGPQGLQLGIDGANGLNNIGLLVRVFGAITGYGTDEFTITDGSGQVKVTVPTGMSVPTSGRVIVTGIASCEEVAAGKLARLIRALGYRTLP